jgi:hypothetical protein
MSWRRSQQYVWHARATPHAPLAGCIAISQGPLSLLASAYVAMTAFAFVSLSP